MTTAVTSRQLEPTLIAPSKASRIHRFGGPEVITLEDMVPAAPGGGEVLVRVTAAGVGPWDAWIRAGKSALPQPLPLTLGSDISGVVEAVGPGVTRFVEGDEVFGVTNPHFTGGYACFTTATAAMLANKPAMLPHIDAASVPVVAVTAWQALFEQARLTPGQSVQVLGAAGNVGAFAVQFAHRAGLQVYATASARDLGYVRNLGANAAFDGGSCSFEGHLPPIDAVIDLIGGENQALSFAVLKQGGTLISTVAPPNQSVAAERGFRAAFF
jgi:NADPH:quinone reductase-like Zn-dependent oxidoreductase